MGNIFKKPKPSENFNVIYILEESDEELMGNEHVGFYGFYTTKKEALQKIHELVQIMNDDRPYYIFKHKNKKDL
jgi:hypothetical protein